MTVTGIDFSNDCIIWNVSPFDVIVCVIVVLFYLIQEKRLHYSNHNNMSLTQESIG